MNILHKLRNRPERKNTHTLTKKKRENKYKNTKREREKKEKIKDVANAARFCNYDLASAKKTTNKQKKNHAS